MVHLAQTYTRGLPRKGRDQTRLQLVSTLRTASLDQHKQWEASPWSTGLHIVFLASFSPFPAVAMAVNGGSAGCPYPVGSSID